MKFLAIDFETANRRPESACAIGLVLVEDNKIIEKKHLLIRPPDSWFEFTYIHKITWDDVKNELTFKEVWGKINPYFRDVNFICAHNSSFDKKVLYSCLDYAGIGFNEIDFQCTMRLSRSLWNLRPTKLPDVCQHFNINLNHHDALSDASACANIMIKALEYSTV